MGDVSPRRLRSGWLTGEGLDRQGLIGVHALPDRHERNKPEQAGETNQPSIRPSKSNKQPKAGMKPSTRNKGVLSAQLLFFAEDQARILKAPLNTPPIQS